jgi:hypothetical protein
MTRSQFALLVPAALALLLAACGKSEKIRPYCPAPFTVSDADRLTHFKPGAGRDPRDVEYEAVLSGSGTTCELVRGNLNITLVMRISASAGPAVTTVQTRVPYFVRVLDQNRNVVQGQEFTADFKLSPSNPRGASQEELSLVVPYSPTGGGYSIAVGLKPTQDELNYNRGAGQ